MRTKRRFVSLKNRWDASKLTMPSRSRIKKLIHFRHHKFCPKFHQNSPCQIRTNQWKTLKLSPLEIHGRLFWLTLQWNIFHASSTLHFWSHRRFCKYNPFLREISSDSWCLQRRARLPSPLCSVHSNLHTRIQYWKKMRSVMWWVVLCQCTTKVSGTRCSRSCLVMDRRLCGEVG